MFCSHLSSVKLMFVKTNETTGLLSADRRAAVMIETKENHVVERQINWRTISTAPQN